MEGVPAILGMPIQAIAVIVGGLIHNHFFMKSRSYLERVFSSSLVFGLACMCGSLFWFGGSESFSFFMGFIGFFIIKIRHDRGQPKSTKKEFSK